MMKTDSGLLMLRTSVRPKMQRQALIRGCLTLGSTVLLLWAVEQLLPIAGFELESLGIWRWLASGGALGAGYLPYKRLRWQKAHPEILQANEKSLSLLRENEKVFSIDWEQVESFHFIDRKSSYGIAFTLKSPQQALQSILSSHEGTKSELSFLSTTLDDFCKQERKEGADKPFPVSPYKTANLPQFLLQKSKKRHGVDLFLPFFSEHSHLLLQQWYDQNVRDE
ncbi:MAG: hypothetical protein JSR46_10470 [Verrucomicrobia bacterium]|nr:hypothetical protein [Verrucomicrobiota bacterium]